MNFSNEDYENLEIVAFDGTLRVLCGAFLPIVRDKRSDRYYKLSPRRDKDSTAMLDLAEVNAFTSEKLITRLPEVRPAVPFALVVWISEAVFKEAELDLPDGYGWQAMDSQGYVGVAVDEQSLGFLNDVARALMAKATNALVEFFAHRKEIYCIRAHEIISMARSASTAMPKGLAPEWSLRAQIILRYALALKYSSTPERLDSVFELRIRREFPNWTWESFQIRVTRLAELLHDQAFSTRITSQAEVGSQYMVLTISKSIAALQSVADSEKVRACEAMAESFRSSYEASPKQIEELAEKMLLNDHVVLNNSALQVLGGEPTFYYFCIQKGINLAPQSVRPPLSSLDFEKCSVTFKKMNGRVWRLIEAIEHAPVMV